MFRYVPELAIKVSTNEAVNFGVHTLYVTDDSGVVIGTANLTGWTFLCQARVKTTDVAPLLSMACQIIGDPTLGQINIYASQASVLAAGPATGSYDLIGTAPSDQPYELWTSDFEIVQGVSR